MSSQMYQSAEEIVTEITMSTEHRPWLVIEGEDDNRFFIARTLPLNPKPVIARGWENVVGVISKVLEENITATVLGFIDRDYREHLGIIVDQDNIVVSDYRDLEVTLFESEAFLKILVELGSTSKIPTDAVGNIDIATVRTKIYETTEKMGRLRYSSLKNEWKLRFKCLDYSKFIDPITLQIDENKLLAMCNSNVESKLTLDDIRNAFNEDLPSGLNNNRFISNGHDIYEVLGISLKRLWGTNNAKAVCTKEISRCFRIGYSESEFANTEMYKRLCSLLS